MDEKINYEEVLTAKLLNKEAGDNREMMNDAMVDEDYDEDIEAEFKKLEEAVHSDKNFKKAKTILESDWNTNYNMKLEDPHKSILFPSMNE